MFPSSAFIDSLQNDLSRDLLAFLPELLLCGAIVLMLFLRLFTALSRVHVGYVALTMTIAALLVAVAQWQGNPAYDPGVNQKLQIFTGLLVYDTFALYVRLFLHAFLT